MADHSDNSSQYQVPLSEVSGRQSSSQLLESLSDDKFKLALSFVVPLVSLAFGCAGGQALMPAALVSQLRIFALSLLVLFASSLSTITFHPKFPKVAEYFDRISVLSIAMAFASLIAAILPDKYRWISYAVCVVPMLPSLVGPYHWLLHKIQLMLTRLLSLDCVEGLPVSRGEKIAVGDA